MVSFSCIITVYAGTVLDYFKESILSIVNQSIPPNEILVVLDGPIQKNVEHYLDSCIGRTKNIEIRKIIIEKNVGAGPARNIGIKNSNFDWIAIMDCDDYSLSHRFEKQIEIISQIPEVDFICSLSDEYADNFDKANFMATKKCPELSSDIKKRLNYNCCITNPSIFFKKNVWQQTTGYNSTRFLNEDHFFFLKIAQQNFNFYCIQDSLIKIRIGKEQRRRRSGLKLFVADCNFRYTCLKSGLIDFKGFLILVPLFFRRFIPAFMLPVVHKAWRAI
jgi:glycosyltransferase involved in cell wall biosynthesis